MFVSVIKSNLKIQPKEPDRRLLQHLFFFILSKLHENINAPIHAVKWELRLLLWNKPESLTWNWKTFLNGYFLSFTSPAVKLCLWFAPSRQENRKVLTHHSFELAEVKLWFSATWPQHWSWMQSNIGAAFSPLPLGGWLALAYAKLTCVISTLSRTMVPAKIQINSIFPYYTKAPEWWITSQSS